MKKYMCSELWWTPAYVLVVQNILVEVLNTLQILSTADHIGVERVGKTRIPRNAVSRLPALFHKIDVN